MNLMDLLPPVYEDNVTMEDMQAILTEKVSEAAAAMATAVNECFIEAASKLLSRWETIYGIPTNIGKSDTLRQQILAAKRCGIGTVTTNLIISVAGAYSNGSVEATLFSAEYRFVVKFTGGYGVPESIDDLTKSLNLIKPAWWSFTYEYTYMTWDQFEGHNHTWDEWDAKNLTWDALEVYKE